MYSSVNRGEPRCIGESMFHLFCKSSFWGFTEYSWDKSGWGECFFVCIGFFLSNFVLFCPILVTTVPDPRNRFRRVRAMIMEALNAETHRTDTLKG